MHSEIGVILWYVTMAPFSAISGVPMFVDPSGAMGAPLPLMAIIWPWLALGPGEARLKPSTPRTTQHLFGTYPTPIAKLRLNATENPFMACQDPLRACTSNLHRVKVVFPTFMPGRFFRINYVAGNIFVKSASVADSGVFRLFCMW